MITITPLVIRRIVASIVDFGFIIIYAILLFLCADLIFSIFHLQASGDPVVGQLIGFLTLTLPVIMYSYFTERGNWRGTIGKKLLRLVVQKDESRSANSILLRNIMKYLPWELAHTGVHWVFFYSSNNSETPIWVWAALVLPQVLFLVYFVSVLTSGGESSIYDRTASTRIEFVPFKKSVA